MPTWRNIRPHDQFSVPINITRGMINLSAMSDEVLLERGDLVIVTEVIPPEDLRDPMGGFVRVDSITDKNIRDLRIPPGLLKSPRDMFWAETVPDSGYWERPALQLGYVNVVWRTSRSMPGRGVNPDGEYVMQRDFGPGQRVAMIMTLGRELMPALKKAWHAHRLAYRNDIIRTELMDIRNRLAEMVQKYPDFQINGSIEYSHTQIDNSTSTMYW